jgi:hypothetical protein
MRMKLLEGGASSDLLGHCEYPTQGRGRTACAWVSALKVDQDSEL